MYSKAESQTANQKCVTAPKRIESTVKVKLNSRPKRKPKIEVIEGNCTEVIWGLGKFDFIFADPPFNIGQKYDDYSDTLAPSQYVVFTRKWIEECWEALKPFGVIALHGTDTLALAYHEVAFKLGMERIAWINWCYDFGQCKRSNWIDARCHCMIFAKNPGHYTWNPDDVLIESARVKYGDKRIHLSERGGKRLPGTVWGAFADTTEPGWGRVQGNSKERRQDHPNQLPELYLKRLILAYTNKGDHILDPFGGSGTTAVVAQALGRSCTTIDVSPSNCKSIRQRLKKGTVRV